MACADETRKESMRYTKVGTTGRVFIVSMMDVAVGVGKKVKIIIPLHECRHGT